MRRSHLFLLTLCLAIASPLTAALSLNPLNWFDGEEETPSLSTTNSAQASEAAAILGSAKQKLESGSNRSANRSFKKIIKDYPTTDAAAEALFLRARILMSNERWVKAFDSLQRIVNEHPAYPDFDKVISSQFDCATALMEGARGKILWVFPGFKQYSTAAYQFERIVGNAPYGDYAPLALMNVALVSEMEEEPEDAIDALDRLINYYPQSMLAPDAYYNLAKTYANLVKGSDYDQGSTRQAISYYEDFLILFPQSNYIGQVESNLKDMENLLATSRLNLGNFYYYYRSNNTAALIFYNEVITIAPESSAAEEAQLRITDIETGVRPVSGASLVRKLLFAD
jgi:outer membrane protein assembly factor BamD